MKILVLNGSPTGENSITLCTVKYIQALFPACTFDTLHVGQKIRHYEDTFDQLIPQLEAADLILFCYPVYTFLVPAQLHRFIELIKERGVDLTGKYATTASNGNPVTFTTTKAGTLTIFFGGDIATNKKIYMTEGENGLTGKVLSTGAEVENGTAPNPTISAWDGLVYNLEAGKSYEFKAAGTKWRLAGFKYVGTTTGIHAVQGAGLKVNGYYNLAGQRVAQPTKGVYIVNSKKVVIK